MKVSKLENKLAKRVQNAQCQHPSLQEPENKYLKTRTEKN